MKRPVIGICSAIESARWAAWEVVVNLSPRTYSLAVQRAGGVALILPPDDSVAEQPDELLDMLDGLILAGGSDIDPASYGAKGDPETGTTWPERDRFELALGTRALERDMPVLGICRGMEMLNVIQGGTLNQHLGLELHRHTPGVCLWSSSAGRCWFSVPPWITFSICMPRQIPSSGMSRSSARVPSAIS